MPSKRNILQVFIGLILALPAGAYADWSIGVGIGDRHHDWDEHRHHEWEEHHYGWHEHPYWGYHMRFLPPGGYAIWVDGVRYYYADGLYYSYAGDGEYIVVNPPVGAYVSAIPPDFHPVIINGRTYYTDDGIYYRLTPRGYRVVPQPVVYEPPPVPVAAPVYTQDSFTINVPNNKGGYTPVVIRKSGGGYVGPQGEYYASFPSVAQLKAMYGK